MGQAGDICRGVQGRQRQTSSLCPPCAGRELTWESPSLSLGESTGKGTKDPGPLLRLAALQQLCVQHVRGSLLRITPSHVGRIKGRCVFEPRRDSGEALASPGLSFFPRKWNRTCSGRLYLRATSPFKQYAELYGGTRLPIGISLGSRTWKRSSGYFWGSAC